jgi:hypothetical protein
MTTTEWWQPQCDRRPGMAQHDAALVLRDLTRGSTGHDPLPALDWQVYTDGVIVGTRPHRDNSHGHHVYAAWLDYLQAMWETSVLPEGTTDAGPCQRAQARADYGVIIRIAITI